jgi:REP element-mobilizing transposase RayT
MSRRYHFQDRDRLHFITYTTVGWIDLFTRNDYRQIITDSLTYCIHSKGLEVFGWVIMTNHIHLIISSNHKGLDEIMRDHKRHTSETLRRAIEKEVAESRREWILELFKRAGTENSNNRGFQLWQQHNRPIELWSTDVIMQKLNYIHNNPVKAGFVEKGEDWIWSSAGAYAGIRNMLEGLTLIEC